MSLYGMMRTGISGMNAQSSRLSTVADNIANADTRGYKRSSAEFSTLVLNSGVGRYHSGGVNIHTRNHVSEQGTLQYTNSATDLAIAGSGHFIVSDKDGASFLTRAGAFQPDADGFLVNADGFRLMGYGSQAGRPDVIANGFDGLQAININNRTLQATPTSAGKLNANMPASAAIIAAGNLPSANGAGAEFAAKTSLITHDSLGGEVTLDLYFAKSAANTWEVSAYDRAGASAAGGFPYSAAALSTQTLSFDPTSGSLTAASASSMNIAITGGQTMALDLKSMTQFATSYAVLEASVNGNAPSIIETVNIGNDGSVNGIFRNGTIQTLAQIALADVPSPDQLEALPGNVYAINDESGDVRIGAAESGGFGTIIGGALEQSTVDIGFELTEMIQAQRTYTANSKVFMTGADLMDVLVNLKR